MLDIFLYEGKNRIPRQDQIDLFLAVCGLDSTPLSGVLESDEIYGMYFKHSIAPTLRVINQLLVVQIKRQRPDALISNSFDGDYRIIKVKTLIPGVTATVKMREQTKVNPVHGMPMIEAFDLHFAPDVLQTLEPLDDKTIRDFAGISSSPGQPQEPSSGEPADARGEKRSETEPQQTDVDKLSRDHIDRIIDQIIADPRFDDVEFDYEIFGFKYGRPIDKKLLSIRFKQYARMFHPDTNPDLDPNLLKRVSQAYSNFKKKTAM